MLHVTDASEGKDRIISYVTSPLLFSAPQC